MRKDLYAGSTNQKYHDAANITNPPAGGREYKLGHDWAPFARTSHAARNFACGERTWPPAKNLACGGRTAPPARNLACGERTSPQAREPCLRRRTSSSADRTNNTQNKKQIGPPTHKTNKRQNQQQQAERSRSRNNKPRAHHKTYPLIVNETESSPLGRQKWLVFCRL